MNFKRLNVPQILWYYRGLNLETYEYVTLNCYYSLSLTIYLLKSLFAFVSLRCLRNY